MIPELTKELRLEIYQKALKIVEDFPEDTRGQIQHSEYFNLYQPAICIILPCIWNNIAVYNVEDFFLDNEENSFRWSETPLYFPEIAERINDRDGDMEYYIDVVKWRKQTLIEAINQLTL